MARDFNPTVRENQLTWQYIYIKTLLYEAHTTANSSLIIYACFETRNLLEKIEFDMVQASMTESQRKEYLGLMSQLDGTKKAFDKLDDSFYHYYIYVRAISKIAGLGEPSSFDIKVSRKYRTGLNDYCHLYSKADEDFIFGSPYLKSGIQKCNDVINYLFKCNFIKSDGSITIIGTTISELEEKSGGLYSKWKKKEIKTEEELITELRKRHLSS